MPKRDDNYLRDKKNAILRSAKRTALRRGLAKTSLRDISADAKLSMGSISNHFPRRQDIINYAAEQSRLEKQILLDELINSKRPVEALKKWMSGALQSEELLASILLDFELVAEGYRDVELKTTMKKSTDESLTAIRGVLEGDLGKESKANEKSFALLALYYGMAILALVGSGPTKRQFENTFSHICSSSGD